MTLRLTPDIIEAAYNFIKATLPFSRWKLPSADEIEFHVGRAQIYGCHSHEGGTKHRIMVSEGKVGRTLSLIATIAHECIHLYQAENGLETKNTEHNADFHKRAKRICALHGYDPKLF